MRCTVGRTASGISLFVMVMDSVADEVRKENQWTMMFADDTVICSETFRQVEV